MTKAEFDARYHEKGLKLRPRGSHESLPEERRRPKLQAANIPEEVNWFEAGKVSISVDQGGCGACWAFTTASTLESLNAI